MITRLVSSLLMLAVAGCATQRRSASLPATSPQVPLGPSLDYGAGIVAASPHALQFALERPANVIVLRVSEWEIEVVRPLHSGDRTRFEAGTHVIGAANEPARASGAGASSLGGPLQEREQRCGAYTAAAAARDSTGRLIHNTRAMMRDRETCLELSDRRAHLQGRLEPRKSGAVHTAPWYWLLVVSDVETRAGELHDLLQLVETDGELTQLLERLPEALVGGRTSHWAAYYVPLREERR